MKKFLARSLALVITLSVVLSVVSACDWITVNTERDLKQVVASVRIDDSVESEDILKRDLKSRYMSYEYQYVYYGSYTVSQAYEYALKNLVQNRVIIQKARIELAKVYNAALDKTDAELDEFTLYFKKNALAGGNAIDPAKGDIKINSKEPYGAVQFLTLYEYKQAYYNVRKTINEMIDSYEKNDEDDAVYETVVYTDRTAPSVSEDEDDTETFMLGDAPTYHERLAASVTLGDEAFSSEISDVYHLNEKVYDKYALDLTSTTSRKKAYNALIDYLKEQGLIGSSTISYVEDPDAILGYEYFANMLKSQMESILVSKYQESLITSTQEGLSADAIWEQYLLDYSAQKAKYEKSHKDYETALDSASDTSLVLYNPFDNYGYVSNILIPFTSEQSADLSDKQGEDNITEAEIKAFREELSEGIYATDQRSSWVYNNHGKYEDGKFFFEDIYTLGSKEADLSSFVGTVEVKDEKGYTVKNDDGADETKWQYKNVVAEKIAYADFVERYLNKIGLSALAADTFFNEEDELNTTGFMSGYSANSDKKVLDKEDLEAIKALTFAFSTDPGILSKEYGYLYSPFTSAGQYVEEFAAAAKAIVEKGVGAYTVVLTDYGYHIMVCTKKVADEYDVENGKEYFKTDLETAGTLAYKYKKVKYDSLTETEISKFINMFIGEVMADDSTAVTYFKDNYADLVTDSSEN